ncbi:MAG: hypothetical protein ABIK13_04310 [Patescibacteria group bacterium]
MKVEDLVLILNNRLREFKLSKDYASMSGDLKRMNDADKEIIDLEDTLFKLNLLVDTSKSDKVKKVTLAEMITDGSVAVLGEYDITSYATDPLHERKIMTILSKMGVMDSAEKIDEYIDSKYPRSPVTGEMIMLAGSAYSVDVRLMMAIMEQDSSFGTAGKAVRTVNPGNVGNDDSGNLRTYDSWQEGVTAVAAWLSRHRGSTIISGVPDMSTTQPPAVTSTQPIIISTTTTTAIATPETPTSTPAVPPPPEDPFPVTTSTPPVITSTSTTSTSTPTSTPATTTEPVAVPPPEDPLPATSATKTTTTATSAG